MTKQFAILVGCLTILNVSSASGVMASPKILSSQPLWLMDFDPSHAPGIKCVHTFGVAGLIDGLYKADPNVRYTLVGRREGGAIVNTEEIIWGTGERAFFVATDSEAWCKSNYYAERQKQDRFLDSVAGLLPAHYSLGRLQKFLMGRTVGDVITTLGSPSKETIGPYAIRYDGLPIDDAVHLPLTGTSVWIEFSTGGEVRAVDSLHQ